MTECVKWGIIAAGGIAKRRTLPAMQYLKNSEIIAVMDTNKAAVEDIAKEYGIKYAYTDAVELLSNSEIDAVYVASPVCFHYEQALKVLKSGKHLLLEKPLGMDANEAEKLARISKEYKQKFGVAMVMRHHPAHQAMKQIVANGGIGDVVSCRAQLTCWFPDMQNNWRQKKTTAGGGALVDMGVHCIDLLRYITGDEPESVYGSIKTQTFNYEVDDSADCILHMQNGSSCFVETHFNIPDNASENRLELYGTKGSIIAAGTIGQECTGTVLYKTAASDSYSAAQVRSSGDDSGLLEYDVRNIYADQLDCFSNAILNDTAVMTTVDDACNTMAVVSALYRSSAEKKNIKVGY